jgi:hypothetical protein
MGILKLLLLLDRYFRYVKQEMERQMVECTTDALPLQIPRVVSLMRQVVPDDGIVCLDNGLYKARPWSYGSQTLLYFIVLSCS